MAKKHTHPFDEVHDQPRYKSAMDSAVGAAVTAMALTFTSTMLLDKNLGPREWQIQPAAYSAAWMGLWGVVYGSVAGYVFKFT